MSSNSNATVFRNVHIQIIFHADIMIINIMKSISIILHISYYIFVASYIEIIIQKEYKEKSILSEILLIQTSGS